MVSLDELVGHVLMQGETGVGDEVVVAVVVDVV